MTQEGQGPRDELLRGSDLRDQIEALDRKKARLVISYLSLLAILGVAFLQGSPGVTGLVVFIMVIVPFKKLIVRHRVLNSKKADLLEALASVGHIEN